MRQVIQRYDQPGKWEVKIPFTKVREDKSWVGVVDARRPGEYELLVVGVHKAEATKGRIAVRVVAGAGARVKIRGVVKIAKNAQDTDSFLELRALTLDKTAVVMLDPELEIEANQVKASHAASVGPIDTEQLLYMQSRGLTKEQAERTIVAGWLGV